MNDTAQTLFRSLSFPAAGLFGAGLVVAACSQGSSDDTVRSSATDRAKGEVVALHEEATVETAGAAVLPMVREQVEPTASTGITATSPLALAHPDDEDLIATEPLPIDGESRGFSDEGRRALFDGRPAEAVFSFRRALSVDVEDEEIWRLLVRAYRESGQHDHARQLLRALSDDSQVYEIDLIRTLLEDE